MAETPWGPTEGLRERRLPPGRGRTAEETARHQRERLHGATTAVVAEKGYADTTVADLLTVAGVSRAAFYRHFDGKQDCFVATYDALVGGVLAAVAAELEGEGPWRARLGGGLAKVLELIAAYPAAAHLCLVDLYGAGPEAIDHSEIEIGRFERVLARVLDESPAHAGLPPVLIGGILGGNNKVITSRVRRGLAGDLPALMPELAAWSLSYQTPPGPIAKPRAKPATGGPHFGPYGDAGRIFDALLAAVDDRGYSGATIEGIAARAGMSAHTFYKHFDSKHDAFVACYDAGLAQAHAFTQPAFEQAIDWPHGFRAAIQAMFAFLAGNPAWTRAAVLESPSVGPAMLQRTDAAVDGFAWLLRPGVEQAPGMGDTAVEACAGAIYALHYSHIRKFGPERLPEIVPACTFLGLAPFIGVEHALAVANDGARSGRRARPRRATA